MFGSSFLRMSCHHGRRQQRALTSALQYVTSHQIEATLLAFSAVTAARALQLEFRTRSQAQSVEEERRRSDELRTSYEKLKVEEASRYGALQRDYETILEEQRRMEHSITERGIAGEQVLRQRVEEAKQQGLIDNYDLQPAISPNKKPDAVIEFKGGVKIVVDSKAPDSPNELLSGSADSDGAIREKYVGVLKGHIRSLSQRNYHADVPESLNRTIMLLPGEGYLRAAYGANGTDDKGLHACAAEFNVLLVGPNGLRSIIQLISFQQAEAAQRARLQDENVQEVLQHRLQPVWTGRVLPNMRKITFDLDKCVKATNELKDAIVTFDKALRAKDALDIPETKKSKLPKEVRDPDLFQGQ